MLDELIHNAPAALPQAVRIGRSLKIADASSFQPIVEKIQTLLDYRIDGRLAMHYALSLSCAEKVRFSLTYFILY